MKTTSQSAGPGRWRLAWGRREIASFLTSFVLHAALLLALGLLVQVSQRGSSFSGLIAYAEILDSLESIPGDDRSATIVRQAEQVEGEAAVVEPPQAAGKLTDLSSKMADLIPKVADLRKGLSGAGDPRRAVNGRESPRGSDAVVPNDADVTGALDGRGREARGMLAGKRGGNKYSEQGVERGLKWLVAHQLANGGWDFNHQNSACQGQCRNPGTAPTTTGATAIALLPFLGAGYTHRQGGYQEVVERGLYYLGKRALATPNGADLQEGTMYAQGLAAIALSEAYAISGDPGLKDLAQRALDFIVFAQDKKGGGWRYSPGEPGDITVTGWELMALKSGQMAGLRVPSPTVILAQKFFDSVQSDGGARYGYMTPQPRQTTTAIGLLCRMYTGWQHNNPALYRGVDYLSQWGPSKDDMYYNYYATQVLYHWEGPQWESWNRKMRAFLTTSQAALGHEAGSWYFSGGRGDRGGRLYNTAMAIMTLEVYYRYMPLYSRKAVGSGF